MANDTNDAVVGIWWYPPEDVSCQEMRMRAIEQDAGRLRMWLMILTATIGLAGIISLLVWLMFVTWFILDV